MEAATRQPKHPQFATILKAFADGQSDPDIAAWTNPPIDRTTIWRWRKRYARERATVAATDPATLATNVAKALETAGCIKDVERVTEIATDATRSALTADPFISHMIERKLDREEMMRLAKLGDGKTPDFRSYAALDRNDIAATQLHAELAGRLHQPAANQVNIYVMAAAGQPREESGPIVDIEPAE